MSHPITTENQIKPLDIDYRDPRGVIVHVTGWNRDKQQVYLWRDCRCPDVLPARWGETSPSDIADGLSNGAGLCQRPFPLSVRPVSRITLVRGAGERPDLCCCSLGKGKRSASG